MHGATDIWRPAPEVFLFAKGRVALYAILRAMGIGSGDEVLLPGYTCVVVPAAVCYTGARPAYYDIDAETYCGDAFDAAARITDATRAVIVQHTYGMPGEDADLRALCRERGVYVIEDCAHGMGGMLDGRPLGTLGDAAFASFQWTKPVSVGLGGVARINNEVLLPAMRNVSENEFSEPSLANNLSMSVLAWAYHHFMSPRVYWPARGAYHVLGRLGWVTPSSSEAELNEPDIMPPGYCERFGRFRMRQLQRALDDLPASVAHRTAIAEFYENWCAEQGVPVQRRTRAATPVYLRFPIRVRERAALLDAARRARIELGDWFNAPLHPDIHHSPGLGYEQGMCPRAERAASQVVNLPTRPNVGRAEAERILDFLADHEHLLFRHTHVPLGYNGGGV